MTRDLTTEGPVPGQERIDVVDRPRLRCVPLELSDANRLVAAWHRHHQPSQGHRFSLGVIDDDGTLHGAAIVGRPVARLAGHPREVLEVVRLVTDGTTNACSCLYAASARAGKALGYHRIQTYILDTELGASLRASGWQDEGQAGGGQWKHTDGKPRRQDQPTGLKRRYAKVLNPKVALPAIPEAALSDDAPALFAVEGEASTHEEHGHG